MGFDLLILLAFNKRNAYKLVGGYFNKSFVTLQLRKALANAYKALGELLVRSVHTYAFLRCHLGGVAQYLEAQRGVLFRNVQLSSRFRIFLDGGCLFLLLLLNCRTYEGLLIRAKAVCHYANLVIEYEFVVDSGKGESKVIARKVQQGRTNRKGRKSRIPGGDEITAVFVLIDIANRKPAGYSYNARSRVL